MPGDHHDHLALQRSRSALRHMWYGDVQEKLPLPWPDAGVYGSGYWPTMQQLNFHLCGTNSECPGLRLNHGERVPDECVLSPAVSVGGNRVGEANTPPPGRSRPCARLLHGRRFPASRRFPEPGALSLDHARAHVVTGRRPRVRRESGYGPTPRRLPTDARFRAPEGSAVLPDGAASATLGEHPAAAHA